MTFQTPTSDRLFAEARALMPGGVSSPARAFNAVGRTPVFIDRAEGAYLHDVDGHAYVDYVLSFGPMILGHAAPEVTEALREAVGRGTSYGACSPLEVALAREVQAAMPHVERLRFVNSGTEATMSALRLARAFTGRETVIKFEGHYHGHADLLLVKAGSGVATLGLPDSPGVPRGATAHTRVARFNDLASVEALFAACAGEVAAVIVEPVCGNMGVVAPAPGFLEGLRALTQREGALLVFDEVMTGFRVHVGGATALYGVTPDLVALGKVIGGGLPVGAYGGRADVMAHVAPDGAMYQAGTLSGNPLAMTAGIATLRTLRETDAFSVAAQAAQALADGLRDAGLQHGVPLHVNHVGTMVTPFFSDAPVTDWDSAAQSDRARFAEVFRHMMAAGVYLPPSPFEAWFTSRAHGARELDGTLEAWHKALQAG
jgi:glutamate-1-semialdehyde 2,1-aminomutase